MEREEFFTKLREQSEKIDVTLNKEQLEKLYSYMNLLIEWNEKINLTAITEPEEIIQKHFIDSLTISKFIQDKESVIDVGTGAGFPGIPLKIARSSVNITLLDALNKRLIFLNEVIDKNSLKDIQTIHFRAEEVGKNKKFREKFDVTTSRAVAALNILAEYMLPLVKVGGRCICMKGSNLVEEIENSKNAIQILGGEIEKVEEFKLPNSDMNRTIVIIKKIKETPAKYPRKAGTPSKEPL